MQYQANVVLVRSEKEPISPRRVSDDATNTDGFSVPQRVKTRPRRSSKEKIVAVMDNSKASTRGKTASSPIAPSAIIERSNNFQFTHHVINNQPRTKVLPEIPAVKASDINANVNMNVEGIGGIGANDKKNSKLYSNVFPSHILEALQTDVGEDIANQHNSVSVLMADIVGFTKWCASVSPVTIIQCLSAYFQILDDIAETLGVYKVETIGDGYQAICGAPLPNEDHAAVLARFALKIIETVPHMRHIFNEPAFDIRVGINSGPIVTGVIRADR